MENKVKVVASLIANQMRKVNSYRKNDPFSVNRYANENQLEGMLKALSVMTADWRIIWEDEEEMEGYDGIEAEGETWLVL